MKKFLSVIYFSLVMVFCCSYAFPDKLPDWQDINSYLPDELGFQKSTVDDFLELCPGVEVYNIDKEIKIISTNPKKTDVFREVNVGFRNGTLDWMEFMLNKEIEMSEIITLYGFPRFIDSEYSDELDYYNYDIFNIAANKDHTFAKSITIFDISSSAYEKELAEAKKNLFFEVFPGIRPGMTTEDEFLEDYPDLLPYMEEEFDTNTSYTLVDELNGAKYHYKKAVFKFENGLLSWINLIPVNSDLNNMLSKVKASPEIEKLDENYDFYTFDNFVLVVSRKYKKVNSIGIVSYDERF